MTPQNGSPIWRMITSMKMRSTRRLAALSAIFAAATYVLYACGGGGGVRDGGLPSDDGEGLLPGQGGALDGGVVWAGGGASGGQGGTLGETDGGPLLSCGEPGTPCCGGTDCSSGGCCVSGICMAAGGVCVGLGGGLCAAGSCGECGGAGQACCAASAGSGVCTAPKTRCVMGSCSKCGELGGPCCANPASGTGLCNTASAICSGNLCIACGSPGSACCPGNQCASGCCYNGNCLSEGTACGSGGGACQAGRCSGCGSVSQACCAGLCYEDLLCKSDLCTPCGGLGETCCPTGGAKPVCQTGTACTGGLCVRCGALGDVCCEGNACNEGCCSAGRCLAVGTPGCSGLDASIQTDAPIGGGSGAIGTGGAIGLGGIVGGGGAIGVGGATGLGGIVGLGGITGSGGVIGTGGATTAGPCGDLVDDMESGTGWICTGNDRVGFWFTYVDDYSSKSTITPAPESVAKPELLSTPRDASQLAMHAYGKYTDYAGLGVLFNLAVEGGTPKTYDASAYTGVRFWAKSSYSYLLVRGQTDATESVDNGGTCTKSSCIGNYYTLSSVSSSWKEYSVAFSKLDDGTATFKASNLWSIEFGPHSCSSSNCSFDFWIDDVRLYK